MFCIAATALVACTTGSDDQTSCEFAIEVGPESISFVVQTSGTTVSVAYDSAVVEENSPSAVVAPGWAVAVDDRDAGVVVTDASDIDQHSGPWVSDWQMACDGASPVYYSTYTIEDSDVRFTTPSGVVTSVFGPEGADSSARWFGF